VLATIGRLERYKGHHRVIAAFARLLARRPQARLLVVGLGPYEAALRELAATLGVADRVSFTHFSGSHGGAALAELLAGVDLVAILSDFETHPLVAIEAAAARRRLLLGDAGGLGELAAAGLGRPIAVDADPEVVATAMDEELRRPAPTDHPSGLSWEECAERHLEVYRRLAAERFRR
jgi:glycosyltransferase involved in cell wall biosynthesis